MKKFTLGCEHDHEFEGWFADAEAIQQQIGQGLLDCPHCGSTTLEKRCLRQTCPHPRQSAYCRRTAQHLRPRICAATGRFNGRAAWRGRNSGPAHGGAGPAPENLAEFKDVGDEFATEARKIHNGESEKQNIYGTCTPEDQRELAEDGIEVLPLPDLPPEH